MSRHDRHSAILDIVMDEGSVHIDDIITRLGVSAATARRDLDHLADQLLVRQMIEVSSCGRRRDPQPRDDVIDMDAALVHDDIEDGRMAIMPRHLDPPGVKGDGAGRRGDGRGGTCT